MQARLCHQGKQSHGFEGNGLTARIGTCDDKSIIISTDFDVGGNDFFGVDQGVSCAAQFHRLVARNTRLDRAHTQRKLSAGKEKRQLGQVKIIETQGLGCRADVGRKRIQNALDLVLLLGVEHAEFVVGIHHRHGLDEDGRTRGRGIVDESLELVFTFCLYGDNVTPIAHGDDVILQDFGVRTADIVLQGLLDAVVGLADLAADLGKLTTRLVGDHILGDDGARNAIFKVSVGKQATEDLIECCFKGAVCLSILANLTGRAQKTADVKDLAHGKHRALDGTLASVGDVDHCSKGRHTLGLQ